MSQTAHEWHEVPVHAGAAEYRCRLCGAEWIANGTNPPPPVCRRVTAHITPHKSPQRNDQTITLHERA